MKQPINLDLNHATFVGIDAHPSTHTALAINRFEEEKGQIRFDNTVEGIGQFLAWLPSVDPNADNVIVGIEGGSTSRHGLLARLLPTHPHVYEVNPVYTKDMRDATTNDDKTDEVDAKLIAEVLTKKLAKLPQITTQELSSRMLSLKKTVGFYEECSVEGTRLKNQLYQLQRERELSIDPQERSVLTLVIREKTVSLKRAKKTKQRLEIELAKLLEGQGKNLTTIKGIKTVLAAKIIAHCNGIERFPNRDKFIRYAGIAPKQRSSGKSKGHKKSKKGNRNLHSTFYLIALNQIHWNPNAKAYFEKKVKEGKTKRQALNFVMKRTATIVYSMLKSGEDYKE